jgi:hypothetical protein
MRTTRSQLEQFGSWIDQSGPMDAHAIIDLYDAIAASPTFDVSASLDVTQWAYASYRDAVAVFVAGAEDMVRNARDFLESEAESGSVTFIQWGLARQKVNSALELLIPAIEKLE